MSTGNATRSLMVIDDDPELLAMLQDLFRGRGFDVVTAPDGEEGPRLKELASAVDELLERAQ